MLTEAPPSSLPDDARHWWAEIVDELRARGRLSDALPIYARLLAQQLVQYQRVTDWLNREGLVLEIRSDKGELKRQEPAPEFRIQQQVLDKILRLAKLLHLDEPLTAPAGNHRNRLSDLLAEFRVN